MRVKRLVCVFTCGVASFLVLESMPDRSPTRVLPPPPPALTSAREAVAKSARPFRLPLQQVVHAAARKHRVSPAFVKSIIAAESGFRPYVVSPKGAIGLMQVMPKTAEEMGLDAKIPEQNVDAGTRYLRQLLNKYRKEKDSLRLAIAAYNAGPGNVDRYGGIPPFPETQAYVERVMRYLHRYEREAVMARNRVPGGAIAD